MSALTGSIRLGEGTAVARHVQARLGTPSWAALLQMAAGVVIGLGGIWLGSFACRTLGLPRAAELPVGIVWMILFYLLVWIPSYQRWLVARFQKALGARGVPVELPVSVSLEPDAIRYRIGDITTEAPWATISEIVRAGRYWVFLAQANSLYVPSRFFGSQHEERTFLTEALGRMTPEARKRSGAAETAAQARRLGNRARRAIARGAPSEPRTSSGGRREPALLLLDDDRAGGDARQGRSRSAVASGEP